VETQFRRTIRLVVRGSPSLMMSVAFSQLRTLSDARLELNTIPRTSSSYAICARRYSIAFRGIQLEATDT
jgi:hypothetical protein